MRCFDPTRHPEWDRLYAEAVAMRSEDGEPEYRAELRAVVDLVGLLRAIGALAIPANQ